MNWKLPDSEEAWGECLSAYLDGELSLNESKAVEAALEAAPERAEQLDALRRSSALLSEWEVDAPEAEPAFLQDFERAAEKRGGRGRLLRFLLGGSRFLGPRPVAFRLVWAVGFFAMGIATGVLGTTWVGEDSLRNGENSPVSQQPEQAPFIEIAPKSEIISPRQADLLMEDLKTRAAREDLAREQEKMSLQTALAVRRAFNKKNSERSKANRSRSKSTWIEMREKWTR